MSTEEKILEMLTELSRGQTEMRSEMGAMRSDIAELKATQAKQGEQIAEMQTTLTRVAVTQEGVVLPRIQALAEGHSELKREIDTLATKKQVEKLAGDVDVIKTVVTQHSREISLLKKAQ